MNQAFFMADHNQAQLSIPTYFQQAVIFAYMMTPSIVAISSAVKYFVSAFNAHVMCT